MPVDTFYISDLDGTLLRNDATVSSYSKSVLHKLLQDGLLFTVASARSVISIRKMLAGLELHLPIIEFNGAFISDLESGRHEVINYLDPAISQKTYQIINSYGAIPFISTFDGQQDCLYYNAINNEGMEWYLNDRINHQDERLRFIEDMVYAFHDKVVCLTIIGRRDILFVLECVLKKRFTNSIETHLIENQYSPGWHWLTIHDSKATKDQAIRALLNKYRRDNYELVVFGDNDNDIKMFQIADRALAVSNATDNLKRYATRIIGSNSEDSVVKFILDDFEIPAKL
jgi:5-amino-6-(5-phospho-D-ribitylamino)uracil phosphatase